MPNVQKAAIKRGNKYLVLLRSPNAKYFPKHWDFPGGKLDKEEDPIKGIKREIFEETSLKLDNLKKIGYYEFDFDNIGEKTHKFTIYLAESKKGSIRISDEHTKFRWVTKSELARLKYEPYIAKLLSQKKI